MSRNKQILNYMYNFVLLWNFTGVYGIYIKAQPTLSYDTARQYTLTISCTDTKDTVQGSFIVYVTRNNPPTFTNLQGNIKSRKSCLIVHTCILKFQPSYSFLNEFSHSLRKHHLLFEK